MMRCGPETTKVSMRRNEGTCCHDQKLPSLDLRRTMPGKDSKEERTFKGLDCATPDPHLRSGYTLTAMSAGCCTSDWKWGHINCERNQIICDAVTTQCQSAFNGNLLSSSNCDPPPGGGTGGEAPSPGQPAGTIHPNPFYADHPWLPFLRCPMRRSCYSQRAGSNSDANWGHCIKVIL